MESNTQNNAIHEHPEIQEHEIKLRVIDTIYQQRFDVLEDLINHVDEKLNSITKYIICSLVIPIILRFYNIL